MKFQAVFRLLEMLQQETDQQHRLSAQDMLRLLKERCGIHINRRTLKSYLDEITDAGYPLNCETRQRIQPNGLIEVMQTDWYLDPKFEASELRLLIDLTHAIPTLPEQQRENLEAKLMQIASPTVRENNRQHAVKYLHRPPAKQLLYTVELICEAIRRNCMVQFQYCSYMYEDGELVMKPRTREDGSIRKYLVSPYEIIVAQGRYYLACCKEPYNTLSHYRVDRISEMTLLTEFNRLPVEQLQADLSEYPSAAAERLYMYSGEAAQIKMRVDPRVLSDVVDWFGDELDITEDAETDKLLISLSAHPIAMQHWAMQYGASVEILEPESLRQAMLENIWQMADTYSKPVSCGIANSRF